MSPGSVDIMDDADTANLKKNERSPIVEGLATSPPALTDTKRPSLLEEHRAFLNQQVAFDDSRQTGGTTRKMSIRI